MTHPNNSYFSNKVQEIHADLNGKITQSSNTIIELSVGQNLFDVHPFFESLKDELTDGSTNSLAFPCVQLDIINSDVICDITIKKEIGFLAILLFDYSSHYEHLHDAAQEKKKAMLNEQAYELTTKYSEEKRAYFEYIQDRIDAKIVQKLQDIVSDIEKLQKTNLDEKQTALLKKIKDNSTLLHQKSIQLKDDVRNDLN
ncbi:hypothetical protein [Ulvibacter litoralis]|uniref:Uncharacterized protein n=1 Tax=Ulvibacter litoralis TaxID=227084 RepID=A0A1G7DJU8_9FLAO|nr:hypothetical protein [Ulvibacter litoralis]GHC43169.1 hypothetical protein GCM10008083_01880 [Ulvibacter litoralis]SDE51772.1 hypothetical protein SAMN05421855_1011024 [Ulvibacter litoralis]